MRSTLGLDIDILTAIKERAQLESAWLGKIASRLIKQALQGKAVTQNDSLAAEPIFKPVIQNGFRSLSLNPQLKAPITLAHVQAIADTERI